MNTSERLTAVFGSSPEITFNDTDKFIIFSDCHRGDNSRSDDFADNQNLFHYALNHYYRHDFTYIELGDGDELWENKKFEDIREAHRTIFSLMRKFYEKKRFYRVLGNHDMIFRDPSVVKEKLFSYYDEATQAKKPLFDGIQIPEGLILRHSGTGTKIFLVHGHQGDLMSDGLWEFSRAFVRYIWKILQALGVNDPISTAKNYRKRDAVDKQIIAWIKKHNQMVIAGHTHRPVSPVSESDPLYFNTGCCVHPQGITGIEIAGGKITLIKWVIGAKTDTGELYANRKEFGKPKNIF